MKKLNSFISLIACFVLALCLFRIYSLEGEIQQLRREMNHSSENISNEIRNINYDVESILQEQMSLVIADSWQFVSADIENKTVVVNCSIAAKEYTPGVTKAYLYSTDNEYMLNLDNGRFTANITLPLFSVTDIHTLSFDDNGRIRNHNLGWNISPRYEYLTMVYADMNWSGRGSASAQDGIFKWQIENGYISVDADRQNKPAEVKSIHMIEAVDGVEVKRTEIPLDYPANKNAVEAAGTKEPRPDYYSAEIQRTNFTYNLKDYTFEIPYGATLNVYIETVDGDGLVHRNQLQSWTVDENGKEITEDFEWWHGAESDIYDTNGNLLFGIDLSQYK